MKYYINDKEGYLNSGEILIIPPKQKVKIKYDSTTPIKFGIINFQCKLSLDYSNLINKPIFLFGEEISSLLDLIKICPKILKQIDDCDNFNGMIIREDTPDILLEYIRVSLERFFIILYCRLNNICNFIINEKEKLGNYISENELVKNIKNYLQENINKQLSIDNIANEFKTNKNKIMKLFKKSNCNGIMEYFNKLKISKIMKEICESDSTFSEISEKYGFSSVYYFSKVFKKYTNFTPTEYSKMQSKQRHILN